MGRIIAEKVKGMNWKAKISLVLIFTLVFSTFMYQGWYSPRPVSAAVAAGANFGPTNVAAGTGAMTAVSGTYTVGAGTNRLLVVVAQWEAAASTNTASLTSATWGGRNLTALTLNGSGTLRNRIWIGYMTEADIALASGTTLNLNIANSANPTGWTVKAAWFTGVDQTTPINHFVNGGNDAPGAATHTFGGNLNVINGGMAYYFETTNGGATYTPPGTYTELYDGNDPSGNFALTAGSKAITANGTENPTITQNAATRYTVTGISLNPLVVTAPTLTSPTATVIGSTTATLGANVTSNGGAALTARGTVWGTAAAPTGNSLAEGGTTTGVFTHARTALTAGTRIFYRGYATNSAGTAYSPDGSFYTEPATQASAVSFTSVGSTGMTVNWTRGTGNGVIVLMRAGSAVATDPTDGTYTGYTANAAFGSGTAIGAAFVVYKGTGTSVAVTGLSSGTTYHVAVYEFAGTVDTAGVDQGTNYKATPAIGNQATTGTCTANTPTLTVTPSDQSVAPGLTTDYTITVMNNDTPACSNTTFNINIVSDSNLTDFNASTRNPVSLSLAPGALGNATLTVSAKASAPIGSTNITTVGVTAAGHTAPANVAVTTTAANPLMHNSRNTGSSKWAPNGWGVAGGRYGEFTCETCHTRTTTNIKRVKQAVTSPNSPTNNFPGSSITFTDTRNGTSDFGDDATAHATSTKVCEVCHTYDGTSANGVKYHAYNMSGGGKDLTHQNRTDCTACHPHSQGFKAAGCDTCHGNPPTNASAGGPTGLANAPYATGSATAGAHSLHATASGFNYSCETCHTGYVMPQVSSVKPGFGDISISFSTFGATTGSYSGQANVSYNNVLGTGTKTCSSVYCHGSTIGGTNPVWDGAVACGDCHGATAATPPTLGNHTRHAGSGGANLGCSKCHGATAGATGHVSGNVTWGLDTADSKFGASARYSGTVSGTTAGRAPSASYATCSNVYCHSNVQGAAGSGAPSSYGTPTWGGAGLGCAGCHLNMDSSASATGNHTKHAQGAANIACATCHSGYTETTTNAASHANYAVEVSINATYGGSYGGTTTPGNGYSTCSSTYCHSSGQSSTGGATPTYATPTWGSGALTCGSCHVNMDSSASATGSHTKHAQGTAPNYACSICHNGYSETTVTYPSHVDRQINLGFTGLGTGTTYSQGNTHAVGNNFGTCSTSYCHSSGQSSTGGATPTYATPTWGAGALTCGSCHVDMDSSASATGSHTQHAQGTTNYACAFCHNGYTETTATASTHVDQSINLSFSGAAAGTTYSQGNTHAVGNNYGTCSASACHGTLSPVWGANTTSATCVKCHGIAGSTSAQFTADTLRAAPGYTAAAAPTGPGRSTGGATAATDAKVGAHDVHLRGTDNISSAIACTQCHSNVNNSSVTFTGHMDGSGTLSWGSLATTAGKTPAYTAPNCTSNYCHTANRPAGGGANQGGLNNAVAWNNTAYVGGTTLTDSCVNKCHAMPPGAGVGGDTHASVAAVTGNITATVLSTCSSRTGGTGCHPTINAGGTAGNVGTLFFDKTQHIDGSVQGGECVTCHLSSVSSPVAAGLNASVTTRRAIVPEFQQASNHVRNKTGGVTNADCGVCHMEGNASDGSINTAYHRDGYIDLRDPDSGSPIQDATWGGTGAGSYTSSGTALNSNGTAANRLVRFSRNLSSNALEIQARSIMINQCLKCHDAGGATHATARVTGGTATNPFNATAASIPGGRVVDVAAQFATSNRSYHPILGKQNNSYTQGARMAAPWNMTKTNGNTTSWGYLMTCDDCHANNGATGTITATVTAHGSAVTSATGTTNAVQLRGYVWRTGAVSATNNTTLCIICHAGYDTQTASNHGAGSAITSNTNSGMTTYMRYACYYCHSAGPAKPARPIPGADAHGFSTRSTGAAFSGTNPLAQGYAFIRSEGFFGQGYLHNVANVGGTAYTATCTGFNGTNGSTNCSRNSMGNYTPGGVY